MLTRLRIAGFKSFADAVSLDILPGLTGIVGPNGCGKSNVVEALRWAMGETSARSLRGGEMDDVIFAGTTARASRNLAEVTITLEGGLPEPFAAEAELQVTRRIERGAGSQYRIQGREQRARDVQTLYADMASGARSSGMVSQGRVSALVNAKPEERRQVLEEAAGITGLHARRHEAELKLRAAEANLSRAEDVRGQLEAAREAMRKQARQAGRYKSISGLIRDAEREHLAILLAAAEASLALAQAGHAAASAAAAGAAAEVAQTGSALDKSEAALPPLRAALSAAERLLERRRMEADGLEADQARAEQEALHAEQRVIDAEADFEQAQRARDDADASVVRLSAAAEELAARRAVLPGMLAAAEANAAAGAMAAEATRLQAAATAGAAQGAQLAAAQAEAALRAASGQMDAAESRHNAAVADLARARSCVPDASVISEAGRHSAACACTLDTARGAAAEAGRLLQQALRAVDLARAEAGRAADERRRAEDEVQEARARHASLIALHRDAGITVERLLESRPALPVLADARDTAAAAAARAEDAEHRLDACEQAASLTRRDQEAAAWSASDAADQAARCAAATAAAQRLVDRLEADLSRAARALDDAERTAPSDAAMHQAEAAWCVADCRAAEATGALHDAAGWRLQADAASAALREAAGAASADAVHLAAEAAGLATAIGQQTDGPGVLDAIDVPAGLEPAIGAALSGLETTSLAEDADRRLRRLPRCDAPAFPPGSQPLSNLVRAPAALDRLLAFTVLLEDGIDGAAIQSALPPGMVAVSRGGALWRWDGQVTTVRAPNPAAVRLVQLGRLAALRAAAGEAAEAGAAAREKAAAAAAAARAAAEAEATARAGLAECERQSRAARGALDALLAARAQLDAVRRPLAAESSRLGTESAAARLALEAACSASRELPDVTLALAASRQAEEAAAAAALALEAARQDRQASRTKAACAQAALHHLERAEAEIGARIEAAVPARAHLRTQLDEAEARLALAKAAEAALPDPGHVANALLAAEAAEVEARRTEAAVQSGLEEAEYSLDQARAAEAAIRAALMDAESQVTALAGLVARTLQDRDDAAGALEAARREANGLPDAGHLEDAAQAAHSAHEHAGAAFQTQRAELQTLTLSLAETDAQLSFNAADLAAWTARHADASARARTLQDRCASARAVWETCRTAPQDLSARAARAAAGLAEATQSHQALQARALQAESEARARAMALREAEQRQAASREALIRAEAAADAANGAHGAVLTRIGERLGPGTELGQPTDTGEAAEERARRKLERLARERDEMGPVNLRAELELAEIEDRAATLEREREELATAIAKLRGAIGHINREGRERLTAVFTQVDQHFRALFTRMMGGGRAHLALTGSDDPLLAGLEIYAEPPGKKLSSLALLSGGEQALTALSLIFAVFRCTPAPISVLDEVDAPLDDANVERFCTLLDDVVRDTGTRFLVVTHHQLTMSRMDRLFGVTMQERGVSRLLSVDLGQAARMVQPVLLAAE